MSFVFHSTHHHKLYRLTCEQYEDLWKRSDGACDLCRTPWDEIRGIPQIDHDHRAYDRKLGVRGLVCAKCNFHMHFVDDNLRRVDERTQRYLDAAWYLTAQLRPAPIRRKTAAQTRRDRQFLARREPDDYWIAPEVLAYLAGDMRGGLTGFGY